MALRNGNGWKENGVSTQEGVVDYRAQPRQSGRGRFVRHYKRFWWLHLIIFLAVFLIIFLVVLYVGMHHIAQTQLNASTLSLYQQLVTNATPSQVHLHLVTISRSNSTFHPTIGAFNCSLFLEDTEPNIIPFGYIQVPAVESLSSKYIVIDQDMVITDYDQFATYNKLILNSQSYRVALRGKTTIKEEKLPAAHVDFNKVITSPGMNGLQGFKVLSLNASLVPAADGSNIRGQVYIPNVSNVSVVMGEVTQNLYVDGRYIGNNTIPNLTLLPGGNVYNYTGVSDQAAVIDLITTKYNDGILPVTIIGNTSIVNGQHIPYFEAALQSATLQTNLDVGAALQAIGINITSNGNSTSSTSSSSATATSTSTKA